MKKGALVVIISVAVLTFLNGCDFATQYPQDSQNLETIDTNSEYYFPPGIYYSRKFKDYKEDINPVEELDRLKVEGVVVAQAWYRGPQTSCSHGSGATHTVIPATFIILLSNVNDSIDDPDYRLLNYPRIYCGQAVKHFRLLN
ncbi:MAG: hypothetical protein SCALA702_23110 [Melioribacteraceae bacterium]|nr:MAG: hypothetical protein SCALA702_23110 [Melioribacteraceae bacterium]